MEARGDPYHLRARRPRPARVRGAGLRRPGGPRRAARAVPPPRGAAAARGERARARATLRAPVEEELRLRRRLLPAGLVHDEAQPAPARARRGAARSRPPAPAAGPGTGP